MQKPMGLQGDPLEIGLYEYAKEQGVDAAETRRQYPRHSVCPFDSALKFMRVNVLEEGRGIYANILKFIRFLFSTNVALFFLLPVLGYSGICTQTALFLFESLAQLAFVYPSRRLTDKTISNGVLNIIIIVASVVLQILTITVPGLRIMLGLVPLDGMALGIVGISLLLTIVGAEIWSRRTNGSVSAS